MKVDAFDVGMILMVLVLLFLLGTGTYLTNIQQSSEVDKQNQIKLRTYQLETERKQAEAMLIYAKALELSCAAELVNEFGEVYTR